MMLPFEIDPLSFGAGFLTAVIIALIVYGAGWFGRQVGEPMKPMKVVLTTNRTPWQVTMGCASAGFLLLMIAMLISIGITVGFLGAALVDIWWMVAAAVVGFLLGILLRAMA